MMRRKAAFITSADGLGGTLYSLEFSATEVGQPARRFVASWQENQC